MSILETIELDFNHARKARDVLTLTFLSTLIADIKKIGKDKGDRVSTDEEAFSVLKKYLKNAEEMKTGLSKSNTLKHRVDIVNKEIVILNKYLPKQLSKIELENIINDSKLTKMSDVMAYLKSKYSGQFDGKLVSDIIKNLQG